LSVKPCGFPSSKWVGNAQFVGPGIGMLKFPQSRINFFTATRSYQHWVKVFLSRLAKGILSLVPRLEVNSGKRQGKGPPSNWEADCDIFSFSPSLHGGGGIFVHGGTRLIFNTGEVRGGTKIATSRRGTYGCIFPAHEL